MPAPQSRGVHHFVEPPACRVKAGARIVKPIDND
jgi:hypothetical protein